MANKHKKYVSRYVPVVVTPEQEKELKSRSERLRHISRMLMALQHKAIHEGLSIEERVLASKYEGELKKWVEDEDITAWLMVGGGQAYRVAQAEYSLATALRKGDYFGMPTI